MSRRPLRQTLRVRLQLANPTEHTELVGWPFATPLEDWSIDGMHRVLGIHRHVVRLIEVADISYVVKELPDRLAEREWQLLRELRDAGLPTADVVGIVTERDAEMDGVLITRHIDYSMPYRTLLSGRGLQIPYLGERLLDAMAGLLVRMHLAGFFWGDCSLSNTLFRRDAGALSAYVIDMETGERHSELSDGQRRLDVQIATENVAGGLLDLQAGHLLADGIDPIGTALAIEDSYARLWHELTGIDEFRVDETYRVDQRLRRLHELGFDAAELELVSSPGGDHVRLVPRVVEHGYHAPRLAALTGLHAGENQARRLLNDVSRYRTVMEQRSGKRIAESVGAARWLTERYEPAVAAVPADLAAELEPAELYHQILEHRWYLSERAGHDVGMSETVASYVRDVLTPLRDHRADATGELAVTPVASDHLS